jgi:hypothetical protein
MFRKPCNYLLAACALAVAIPAATVLAQVQATMVLKNGQRHTGNNLGYRVDGREVSVRVSFSDQQRIPVDQVAYVDFGGTADVNPNLSGSEEAVVLRDGSVIKGQIIELGHQDKEMKADSYLVIVKPSNGAERRLPVSQVARVYFSGGANAAATSGSTAQVPEGQGIAVPGNQQWTPTGITVRRGENVNFNTTGEVRLSADPADVAGSAGARSQRYAQNAPLPGNFAGALIARVGNGEPFPIGNQSTVTMPAAGQLFLGINDDAVADNQGGFRVTITRSNRRR